MYIKIISTQALESEHIQSHIAILMAMGCEKKTLPDGSIAIGSTEKNQAIRCYPEEWFEGDFSKLPEMAI